MNKIYTLKNGLTIVFYQDNSKHSTYANLIVKYGAINNHFMYDNKNYFIKDGMSHFIEHLLIEHSKYGNVGEFFQNNYVYSNGATSYFKTNFYIKTNTNFEDNLEKLITMVNCPYFNKEDIEVTKIPIYEEIRKSKDNNFKSLNELQLKCLFKIIDFVSVLGEEENIKSFDYDLVRMCYNIFYQPKNQILAIAGKCDIEKIVDLVEKIYDDFENKKIVYQLQDYNEPNEIAKFSGSIYKNINENFIRMIYKINISGFTPYEGVKLSYYLNYFLNSNFNETSNAYRKLIDDKISVSSIGHDYIVFNGFLIIFIDTYTNKFEEFIELINDTIKNSVIPKETFELKKKKTIISLILREENFITMINPFMDNILTYNYYDIDKISDIEAQTYDDFSNMISKLDFSNYCIVKMLKDDINSQ